MLYLSTRLDGSFLLAEQTAQEPSSTTHGTDGDDDRDRPIFSHVTGQYRHAKRYGEEKEPASEQLGQETSSAVVLRNADGSLMKLEEIRGGSNRSPTR